ncbi:hypothetical protein RRG08_018374 [Elysia crispata]|uniref:ShKT domain-containing protein n=1 Tax=Elysia crispata TaxID=231223 RepID=A0AAE1D0W5_9GAST|nr:hypothetical protein RRG08_018374 [Elysia crispata]
MKFNCIMKMDAINPAQLFIVTMASRAGNSIMALFTPFVTLAILLSFVAMETAQECSFPKFLVKKDPWVGDYVQADNFLVAYIREKYMDMNEPVHGAGNVKYKRSCLRKVTDTKYIIRHIEAGQAPAFVCTEFFQRAENIVQVKSSEMSQSSGDELCDDKRMELDAYPLINSQHESIGGITCPFVGGYNINANFHNKTIVCSKSTLLMRLESECDTGEGITIDFREKACIPAGLPQVTTRQRLLCVAHWTQANYTFIILRHSTKTHQYFCMRISDPLSDIRSAYLWFKAICDKTPEPDPHISTNYIRMNFTRRQYNSACEDEIDVCDQVSHLCDEPDLKKQCARTCKQCRTENQIGLCPFEEQYRGRWLESSTHKDILYHIDSYTLSRGQEASYDCLRLEEDKMKEKRVLLELSNNGCLPRYACVEMRKVTSSVMRFRLGNRVIWPLPSKDNMKLQICKEDNFRSHTRGRHSSRSMARKRPDRLLVNTEAIQEVACEIPSQLHNGLAFNEEVVDGRVCEGCLNFNPHFVDSGFMIQPTNCSGQSDGKKSQENAQIQYSCLASFNFHNRSHSVVTKTIGFSSGLGQYLAWVFTPKGKIQVMKAAETFVLEHRPVVPLKALVVEFSVQAERNMECRNKMFLPRTTSTPRPTHAPFDKGFWDPDYRNNDGDQGAGDGAGSGVKIDDKGEIIDEGGYETVDNGGGHGSDRGGEGGNKDPWYDESKGKGNGVTSLPFQPSVVTLLSLAVGVTFMTSEVLTQIIVMPLRTHFAGHMLNIT